MIATALTVFFAVAGGVLAALAISFATWAKFASTAAPGVEFRWGLANFLDVDDYYCYSWVQATAVMIVLSACFFFVTLLAATRVLLSPTQWKTKPLRRATAALAFLTFSLTLFAVSFWIAHCEWASCWMGYSDATWDDVHSTYKYIQYDVSFYLACAACAAASLMWLFAGGAVLLSPSDDLLMTSSSGNLQHKVSSRFSHRSMGSKAESLCSASSSDMGKLGRFNSRGSGMGMGP